jgi:S-methylmethionine-dependent homocysteine/selenocysteine methylase
MKPGDLVRVYTIANTHVDRGAYAIIVRKNTYHDEWWIVYVISDDKLYTFHQDQLRAVNDDQRRDKIDIHKSYRFFEED